MFDLASPVDNMVIIGAIGVVFAIVAAGLIVVKYYEKRYKEQR